MIDVNVGYTILNPHAHSHPNRSTGYVDPPLGAFAIELSPHSLLRQGAVHRHNATSFTRQT